MHMDETYLSCVNVGKNLLKDVCLPWINQRVNKNKLEIGQQSDSVFSYCKGHGGMRQLTA